MAAAVIDAGETGKEAASRTGHAAKIEICGLLIICNARCLYKILKIFHV